MKRHAPATARNSDPIARVLSDELPAQGTVLEVASGTGEHVVFLARRFPHLLWQPSDADAQALQSIAAWREEEGSPNLLAPLALDAASTGWPVERADAIVCINMAHISPWEASVGLFAGSASVLPDHAPLLLYGPFREAGVPTAPSNEAFDADLRARDQRWGLRSAGDIDDLAQRHGFTRTGRHAMPANNLTLVYRKGPAGLS